jgi:hypothetical protein
MSEAKPLEATRKAKEHLKQALQGREWFRSAEPGLFKLRLNVDPDLGPASSELPSEYEGIPVDVLFIRAYRPR